MEGSSRKSERRNLGHPRERYNPGLPTGKTETANDQRQAVSERLRAKPKPVPEGTSTPASKSKSQVHPTPSQLVRSKRSSTSACE